MNNNSVIKDALILKTAEQLGISPAVVDKVVMNQFKQANKAMKENKEVEISGFGKFLLSKTKINRRITKTEVIKERLENLLSKASTHEEVVKINTRLDGCITNLSFYKNKLESL